MIEKLYRASQAGVSVQLIIRGICCLIPGVPGFSENIEVISIVDRFLEHSRVFLFCHGGEDLLFLSSADWMVRNLSYRIETAFPVYDPTIKAQIQEYLLIQLADNTKARVIDQPSANTYKKTSSALAIRSQLETYFLIKRKTDATL
jgi:polyphosphate kinase